MFFLVGVVGFWLLVRHASMLTQLRSQRIRAMPIWIKYVHCNNNSFDYILCIAETLYTLASLVYGVGSRRREDMELEV